VVGKFGEFGFGGAARFGLWRECVEETSREELWIVFHDLVGNFFRVCECRQLSGDLRN
jgi:hypothetical protein